MKKLIFIALTFISIAAFGQADVTRTGPVGSNPATTATYNKQAVRDANLTAVLNLRIPVFSSFSLRNAKDSIGYLMYNTSISKMGIYKGSGVWDTISVGNGNLSSYYTKTQSDARYPQLSGSYSNPAWITALAWSKITGTPTTLSGYGITDAVPSSRTITINGTSFDLSANRTYNVGTLTSITPGIGFTSATPITISGTLNVDSTTFRTVLNSWTKAQADARYQGIYPGLQDSLTKKANRTFDNVAAGAIANAKLANSSLTIGSTNIALGGTSASLTGLTSVGLLNGGFTTVLSGSAANTSLVFAPLSGIIPMFAVTPVSGGIVGWSGTAGAITNITALPNGTTATTQSPGDNTTKVATTAYVDATGSGTVTNVSGTTNRITVTNPTTTPVIDISSAYIGQNTITTLGTIITGVWNGSVIDIAHGGTNSTTQNFVDLTTTQNGIAGGKQFTGVLSGFSTGSTQWTLSNNGGENGLTTLAGAYIATTANDISMKPTNGSTVTYTTFLAAGGMRSKSLATMNGVFTSTISGQATANRVIKIQNKSYTLADSADVAPIVSATANTVFGNNTGSTAAPGFQTSINIAGTMTAPTVVALSYNVNGDNNALINFNRSSTSFETYSYYQSAGQVHWHVGLLGITDNFSFRNPGVTGQPIVFSINSATNQIAIRDVPNGTAGTDSILVHNNSTDEVRKISATYYAVAASAGSYVTTDQTSAQTIGATGARLTKLWATDITVTNAITGSVTGNAATVTNGVYTTTFNTLGDARYLQLTGGAITAAANPLILIATGTSGYTEYRYSTSTTAGYIGTGSSILSSAANSDFIMRSEGAIKLASGGNNLALTISSTQLATFSSGAVPTKGTGAVADANILGVQSVYSTASSSSFKLGSYSYVEQTAATSGSIQALEGQALVSHTSGTVVAAIATIGNIQVNGSGGTTTWARSVQGGGAITAGTVTNWARFYASAGSGSASNNYSYYSEAGAGIASIADGMILGGALSGTSATFSGLITTKASGQIMVNPTSGTSAVYSQLVGTGNSTYYGQESSTGGGIFTGTSAYASVFGSSSNVPVQLAANNAVGLTLLGNGYIGAGTTNPLTPFVVKGTTNNTGLEFGNAGASGGFIQSYDRVASAYRAFGLNGDSFSFNTGSGATTALSIASNQVSTFTTATAGANPGIFINSNASTPNGIGIQFSGAAPNNNTQYFIGASDNVAVRFTVYSNGGIANYSANNVNLSDERAKKKISDITSYWDKFKGIRFVQYQYKDEKASETRMKIGVLAQQIETVAPEWVSHSGSFGNAADGTKLLAVYEEQLSYGAYKALQEAMSRIEVLEAEVKTLKK